MSNKLIFCKSFLIQFLLILFVGNVFSASSIKIIHPNGGENLKINTNIMIKWQSQNLKGDVVIILYKRGIKHSVISQKAINNGNYKWKIPSNLPEGNDYRIRIRALKDLSINDFSDRNFSLKK